MPSFSTIDTSFGQGGISYSPCFNAGSDGQPGRIYSSLLLPLNGFLFNTIKGRDTVCAGILHIFLTANLKASAQNFFAELINGNWENISPLKFNSLDYNVGFPFLTDDGQKLFFSSQDPQGKGGFDIYVSQWNKGQRDTPKNLGEKINTVENEVFPFFHSSGKLYFSSRGHGGKGGLDIFYSELVNVRNQHGELLPFYVIPIGGIPKYQGNWKYRKVN